LPEARRDERGSAVVEFALVVPVLMVFLLAMIQAGLLLRDQLVVLEAARAGAREASVSAADEEVRAAAAEAAAALDPAALSVTVQRGGGQGQPVTVDVAYAMAVTVPFVERFFPSVLTLRGSATMRQEFVPP
jgi:Flp pilus assembly protein TadG